MGGPFGRGDILAGVGARGFALGRFFLLARALLFEPAVEVEVAGLAFHGVVFFQRPEDVEFEGDDGHDLEGGDLVEGGDGAFAAGIEHDDLEGIVLDLHRDQLVLVGQFARDEVDDLAGDVFQLRPAGRAELVLLLQDAAELVLGDETEFEQVGPQPTAEEHLALHRLVELLELDHPPADEQVAEPLIAFVFLCAHSV